MYVLKGALEEKSGGRICGRIVGGRVGERRFEQRHSSLSMPGF